MSYLRDAPKGFTEYILVMTVYFVHETRGIRSGSAQMPAWGLGKEKLKEKWRRFVPMAGSTQWEQITASGVTELPVPVPGAISRVAGRKATKEQYGKVSRTFVELKGHLGVVESWGEARLSEREVSLCSAVNKSCNNITCVNRTPTLDNIKGYRL